MKQIQKRYIYSGLTASVFFIGSYVIFDFHFVVSLILTGLIYLGGILFFKEKDIRVLNGTTINNYYFLASKCANQAGYVENEDIKKCIENITTFTDEIIVSLSQRPKKVEQVFDFFDYYLDITYKMLLRYNSTQANATKTQKDEEFLSNAHSYLSKIEEAFKRQLDNMKEARMLDIESEIRIFERTLGIKKSDM